MHVYSPTIFSYRVYSPTVENMIVTRMLRSNALPPFSSYLTNQTQPNILQRAKADSSERFRQLSPRPQLRLSDQYSACLPYTSLAFSTLLILILLLKYTSSLHAVSSVCYSVLHLQSATYDNTFNLLLTPSICYLTYTFDLFHLNLHLQCINLLLYFSTYRLYLLYLPVTKSQNCELARDYYSAFGGV